MKNILYILLFISSSAVAQNLVPNPSFEQNTSCPDAPCQIHRSAGWSSWGYSPDYYNSCAAPYPVSWVSIPQNALGYQYAFTGNAYAGFYAYDSIPGPNVREYFASTLSSSLIIGQKYFVSFRVSLADISTYGTNKLGALFTTNSYFIDSSSACTNTITNLLARNFAHVYTNAVLMDTANWTQIFGSFTADSAYRYLAIGNHFNDANSLRISTGVNSCCAAYYYVDDIYVGTDSLAAVGIAKNEIEGNIFIYPNPASDEIRITFLNNYDNNNNIVRIYDMLGVIAEEKKISAADNLISLQNLKAGVYFVSVQIKNKIATRKLIVTKN